MTLRHAGIVALTFLLGCTRFGYDALHHVPIDPIPDARRADGGTAHEVDAAVADAESRQDASALDGSALDASAPDPANPDSGTGPSDAAPDDDDAGVVQNDGGMHASMDGGAMDGGSSGLGPCAFTVTKNTYLGSPNFHGWLSLQNAGATTWTTPTIRFDLPSSVSVCDDPNILPGAGWELQSSGGHCTYTRTGTSLSIAPGATLDFEYSSDNSTAPSDPAATSVSVSGCP